MLIIFIPSNALGPVGLPFLPHPPINEEAATPQIKRPYFMGKTHFFIANLPVRLLVAPGDYHISVAIKYMSKGRKMLKKARRKE
jgi:hypothetical protein